VVDQEVNPPEKRVVDQEVNITEKRRPRRLMRNLVFRCRKMFGIEKKRKGG